MLGELIDWIITYEKDTLAILGLDYRLEVLWVLFLFTPLVEDFLIDHLCNENPEKKSSNLV